VLLVDIAVAVQEPGKNGNTRYRGILPHYLESGDAYYFKTGNITINPVRKKIKKGEEYYEDPLFHSDIFARDAVTEALTAGLADNRREQAVGLSFQLEPSLEKGAGKTNGKGMRLVFSKDEKTAGYLGTVNGKETHTVTGVRLDIFPFMITITED